MISSHNKMGCNMKKLLKIFFGLNSCMIIVLLVFYCCATFIPLDILSRKEKITIYDINQDVIYESNFNKVLTWYELEDYPKRVIDLIIQIEDKRFYSHLGFDPIRITKALVNNLKAQRVVEGGSSISQQMAKNLFLSNDQTITRKLQELFYASQMEMQYSKEEILEGYLNTLYFGHGVYGFHEASEYFFDKPLYDCSTTQIVMMIGILNGPSIYSPYINYEASINKTHTLLTYLKNENYISERAYQESIHENIQLVKEKKENNENSYYIQAVLDELHTMKIDSTKGISVYTNYDPKAQHALTSSIKKYATKDECETSGIILNPQTGGILALAGGKNYTKSEYIRPLYSKRQVGSTIKPLLYYDALENGFTPSTVFMSSPTRFQIDATTVYAPINYDHRYPYRDISMINAIAVSDNIYAMKTHLFLGIESLTENLNKFNIQTQTLPSNALGTCEMSLLELTSIYNTFASMGIYTKPTLIKAIYQQDQVLYENSNGKQKILDQDITLVLNQLLTSTFDVKNKTVTMPTLFNVAPKVKVSAKSGTSDFDSLIVGYNPDYTIGIWSGFDDGRVLKANYFQVSKNVFKSTFNSLYEDTTVSAWYPMSENIESKRVDPISGKPSLLGSEYWYIKE